MVDVTEKATTKRTAVAAGAIRTSAEVVALISTGGKHAIASRGPFVAEGDWVWRWKDRIDRTYMAKFALPESVERSASPPDGA